MYTVTYPILNFEGFFPKKFPDTFENLICTLWEIGHTYGKLAALILRTNLFKFYVTSFVLALAINIVCTPTNSFLFPQRRPCAATAVCFSE